MAELFEKITGSLAVTDWAIIIVVGLLLCLLLIKNAKPKIQKLTARDDVRGYSLIYADQKQGKKHEEDFGKLLYSAKYELQGKPDYIFQNPITKKIVPVELKSGEIDEEELPHHGDLLQLGAYFLILEDVYGQKPPFGRIVYQEYMFENIQFLYLLLFLLYQKLVLMFEMFFLLLYNHLNLNYYLLL